MSRIDSLQIAPIQSSAALSPAQKRFNTLLRQIEKARASLTAWQDGIAAYRLSHAQLLQPLQVELVAGRRLWILALGAAIDRFKWTRAERTALRELLCEAAAELLNGSGDDAELKALFEKHAEVDFDTDQRERIRSIKEMAEEMTGLDLGDDDGLDSDEALLRRLQEGMQQQAAAEEAQRSEKAAQRRKSPAQQRRESEAQQATQSVREIYRKLASTLHPDRETDAQQRDAKTALMQRVNQAYERQDLLALLELQLQIEQIDASHIAGASEQRLKHYNKVLGDQLKELKSEVESVELAFCMEFGLTPGWGLQPRKLGQILQLTLREWQADLATQQHELRMFDDMAATKRWLKQLRQQQRDDEFDFLPF